MMELEVSFVSKLKTPYPPKYNIFFTISGPGEFDIGESISGSEF
jgi:hypothetical protein